MIKSASYTAATGSTVAITMTDGTVWIDDASLSADTDIRRRLALWISAGNVISPFALSFTDWRIATLSAIATAADALLSSGAPVDSGLHIALDDGSRADLTAMAATATAASTGAVPWPESYARGWIAIENVRIPLATPADGLALAASAGNYYAAIVQHRRDLKDAALAAEDEAALQAIDITAGWPSSQGNG